MLGVAFTFNCTCNRIERRARGFGETTTDVHRTTITVIDSDERAQNEVDLGEELDGVGERRKLVAKYSKRIAIHTQSIAKHRRAHEKDRNAPKKHRQERKRISGQMKDNGRHNKGITDHGKTIAGIAKRCK